MGCGVLPIGGVRGEIPDELEEETALKRWTGLIAAAGLVALGMTGRRAEADSFAVSYLGAGVQAPTAITTNVETFTGKTYNGTSMITSFNNSGITGTYTGQLALAAADQFGGAGGTGQYITTVASGSNAVYTLTLSSPLRVVITVPSTPTQSPRSRPSKRS